MAIHDIAVAVEALPFQTLDVYVAARELAALVHRARIADPELRDQATRAAKSVFLNLCEGLPSDSRPMRRKHFALANGSVHEVVGAVGLACAIGAMAPEAAARAQALAVRVKRMLARAHGVRTSEPSLRVPEAAAAPARAAAPLRSAAEENTSAGPRPAPSRGAARTARAPRPSGRGARFRSRAEWAPGSRGPATGATTARSTGADACAGAEAAVRSCA